MGIRQTLEQISTSLNSAYTSIGNKGGTVPTDKTLSNLPDSINSIELIADYEEDLESLLGKCVDSVSISGDWTNTQYAGSAVDYTGLTFTVTYNDGTTATVTPTSISPSVWGSTVGEQTCTFTYEENKFEVSGSKTVEVEVLVLKKVGGYIFYIDNTADGTYQFYDANGDPASAPTVGTNCTNWTYTVTGATKDKFYVYAYNSMSQSIFGKYWGYLSIVTSANNNYIGAGKINTEIVLAIPDTSQIASDSIWEYIKNMRTNKTNNCDDWYLGCEDEYDLLRTSGTSPASWFTNYNIWSSRESSGSGAYSWGYSPSSWDAYQKYPSQCVLIPIRSF